MRHLARVHRDGSPKRRLESRPAACELVCGDLLRAERVGSYTESSEKSTEPRLSDFCSNTDEELGVMLPRPVCLAKRSENEPSVMQNDGRPRMTTEYSTFSLRNLLSVLQSSKQFQKNDVWKILLLIQGACLCFPPSMNLSLTCAAVLQVLTILLLH